MAHKLLRFTEKLYETPHLISPQGFSFVEDYLTKRNLSDWYNDDEPSAPKEPELKLVGDIGFVDISGPLTYRPVKTMCSEGGSNYQTIVQNFSELIEAGAKTIVMSVSSPGGEAFGAFVSAAKVRKMVDEAGVKIVARVEEMAASAAYIWTCIADEVVVHEDARIGSIGVVIALQNDSEYYKKNGVERTFVYAGENKIPFKDDGSFREEFIADLQSGVDKLYEKFTTFVDTHRNLEAGTAKSTQAKMFDAEDAAEIGLIDYIMDDDQFLSYLMENTSGEKMFKKLLNNVVKTEEMEMTQVNEVMAQLAEAQELITQKDAALANVESQMQELASKLAQFEAAAQEAEAKAEAVKKAAEMAAMQARKEKLAEVIGADNPSLDATFEAVKSLDSEAFNVVVAGFAAKFVQESQGDMFKETGVSGEAEAKEVATESPEMTILKAKYLK